MRVTITWSHWSPIDQDYPRLSSPAPQLTRTRANYQHATFMKYFWVLNEIFLARAAVGLCPQFCWSEYREIIFWSQLVNPLKHSSLHSAGVLSSPQHHADTNWPGSNSRLGSAVTPSFKSSGGWLVVTILMTPLGLPPTLRAVQISSSSSRAAPHQLRVYCPHNIEYQTQKVISYTHHTNNMIS